MLQAAFALLDPPAVAGKFRGLTALEPGGERAEAFVAVEDWLQDGVPLAGPAALEILWHWYAANLPARGLWRPNGRPVLPERLKVPVFLAIPRRDRIVPPASAEALAARLPNATVVRPERRPRLHGGGQPPAGGALRAARGLDAAIGSEADRRVRRLPATYYKAQDRSGT